MLRFLDDDAIVGTGNMESITRYLTGFSSLQSRMGKILSPSLLDLASETIRMALLQLSELDIGELRCHFGLQVKDVCYASCERSSQRNHVDLNSNVYFCEKMMVVYIGDN